MAWPTAFKNRRGRFRTTHRTRSLRPSVDQLEGRVLLADRPAVPALAHAAIVDPTKTARTLPPRRIDGLLYTHHGTRIEALDLYLPGGVPPSGGWPVILGFPGGGWRQASRKDYGAAISVFTRFGYAVAGVDYTYASPFGGRSWPTNVEDARAAVVWVRHYAPIFGFNPNKIVAMGESAGAHIALMLGTNPDGPLVPGASQIATTEGVSSRVAAVVDFYGPTNLTELYQGSRPAVLPYFDTFLGGPPSQLPDRYVAASPMTYVSSQTAPTLIVQGLSDQTVTASQSLELDEALTGAGVRHTLLTIPWAGHGFRLNLGQFSFVPDILNFLNGALNHGPVPPSRSIG